MLHPKEYYQLAYEELSEAGRPEIAEKQRKYMRGQFDYFGTKAPVWTGVMKPIFKKEGVYIDEKLIEFARLCYDDEHRELHYVAIEMVQKTLKKQDKDFIVFLEELITTNSWWDTVDWLAKLVGMHFLRFPDLIAPTTEKWMQSDDFWLQRVAIIFQLFYREKTNTELLFDYILRVAHSKEFFLQKAAGWALRQHTRTNPDLIVAFVEKHEDKLSSLTKREALRLLK